MRKLSDKYIVRIAILLISSTFFIMFAGTLSSYDEFDSMFRSYVCGEVSGIISDPPVILIPEMKSYINMKRI